MNSRSTLNVSFMIALLISGALFYSSTFVHSEPLVENARRVLFAFVSLSAVATGTLIFVKTISCYVPRWATIAISVVSVAAALFLAASALAMAILGFDHRDPLGMIGELSMPDGRLYIADWPQMHFDSRIQTQAVWFERRLPLGFFTRGEFCMSHDLQGFRLVDATHIECTIEGKVVTAEFR